MNTDKIINQASKTASKTASKAKDGILKHQDEVYTLIFSQIHWNYKVLDKDGDFVININEKSLAKAKNFLKFWLEN